MMLAIEYPTNYQATIAKCNLFRCWRILSNRWDKYHPRPEACMLKTLDQQKSPTTKKPVTFPLKRSPSLLTGVNNWSSVFSNSQVSEIAASSSTEPSRLLLAPTRHQKARLLIEWLHHQYYLWFSAQIWTGSLQPRRNSQAWRSTTMRRISSSLCCPQITNLRFSPKFEEYLWIKFTISFGLYWKGSGIKHHFQCLRLAWSFFQLDVI